MKKLRALNGYFLSSTQAMSKLKEFQLTTNITQYRDQKHPKKPLQDVVTRWWSTYRSLRRTRWLKKAIKGLIVTEQVTIEDLSPVEWSILHQVEIALETMAYWQRILEGDTYVTGSLVCVAIYKIREAYVNIISSAEADPSVIDLTRILLDDFDSRYQPSSSGKVTYFPEDVVGRMNRYVGLHQYFFFSSFLDPRTLPMLRIIITEEDYKRLKDDLILKMIELSKSSKRKIESAPSSQEPAKKKRATNKGKKTKDMFRGLNSNSKASMLQSDDNQVHIDCIAQLNRYIIDAESGMCPLHDDDDNFNDPLMFWQNNQVKYEFVAALARIYLPIPATSAPSERIWSRASRILSLRRARLKDDLVSRMMFVKENINFLRKHYVDLVKEERDEHLHASIHQELEFLPPLELPPALDELEVGQDDHLLNF